MISKVFYMILHVLITKNFSNKDVSFSAPRVAVHTGPIVLTYTLVQAGPVQTGIMPAHLHYRVKLMDQS